MQCLQTVLHNHELLETQGLELLQIAWLASCQALSPIPYLFPDRQAIPAMSGLVVPVPALMSKERQEFMSVHDNALVGFALNCIGCQCPRRANKPQDSRCRTSLLP